MTEPREPQTLDDALWRVPCLTPTLPPATRTNTYVVGLHRRCAVDPAPSDPGERQTLRTHLKDVHALVLTHHHHDHVGAARTLREELGVPVYAHAETAARLDFPVDHLLRPGDALPCDGPAWEAIFTPGHAAGHLCFLRASDRALIAGDMVAGVGTILVDPDEGSMRLYLESLARLEALRPSVLYPAHGHELRPGVDALRFYLAHRRERALAVVERLRAGDTTPAAMVPHIYVDTPTHMYALAARSVLAMLRLHEEEGLASTDGERWFLRVDST